MSLTLPELIDVSSLQMLHFRTTFDQAAVGIAHAGLDGRWLLVNRKLCAILGYSEEDLQSMTYREITHPDDRDISIEWHRKLVAGEVENYSLEKRYIRKDGSFVWVNVSLSQVHSDGGISDYLIAVVEDITARKKTEDALKEREEWYRTLFERANDGIIIVQEGRFKSSNSKAQEIFRCTEEQLLEQTPWRLSPTFQPDGSSSAEKAAEKESLALAGTPQLFEWRHRRNDGTLFDAEVNLSRVECQGKAELLAIIRDITERKRVEEALKDSEEEKSLILNSTMDLIIYHDPHMKILWGNQRALDSVGMNPDEMAGRHCWELWHHRDQACPDCPVALALNTGQPHEAEIRSPDKKAWNIRGFPIKDSEGRVKGVVEFCLDDTERKRAEEALQQAHDCLERRVAERTGELAKTIDVLRDEIRERHRIEETLKAETAISLQAMEKLREKDRLLMHQSRQAAMGEMLGNIAHQWRQPLNNLGLLVQELKFDLEWGGLTQQGIDVKVQKSMELISHMSQTIDDFRNFFKPDKEKKPFDVCKVVSKAISLMEGSLRSHGIRTIVDEKEGPFVTGFANEFSQVVINIFNNAKDALIDRKVRNPLIVVTVATEEENAVVRITDNAGGVPEEVICRIFDPYFTTKEPDQGTGVGLFMSKRIIENNMNGSLRVTNTGEGAEFTIQLQL